MWLFFATFYPLKRSLLFFTNIERAWAGLLQQKLPMPDQSMSPYHTAVVTFLYFNHKYVTHAQTPSHRCGVFKEAADGIHWSGYENGNGCRVPKQRFCPSILLTCICGRNWFFFFSSWASICACVLDAGSSTHESALLWLWLQEDLSSIWVIIIIHISGNSNDKQGS